MGIESTGLEAYLVTTATVTTTKANCATAIAAGKQIGKIKDGWEVGATRSETVHKYITPDATDTSLGGKEYGDITITADFSATDTAGQAEIKTIFGDRTARKLVVKNTDGNYTVVEVKCKEFKKIYTTDDYVMYRGVLKQNGDEAEVTS